MTEEQLMARRALQEALDRRDNGGPPPAMLRQCATSESQGGQSADGAASRRPAAPGDAPAEGEVGQAAPSNESGATEEVEPALGVPYPRVAAARVSV